MPKKELIRKEKSGMTLLELMIATSILSICVLGLIYSFSFIQRSIQVSRNKSLANNLAQEKMQILKQKNYHQVLVTPDPEYNTAYTPSIPYDNTYFPPETPVISGGVDYTVYSFVEVAQEDSGAIVTLSATTPDTGMKLITITVVWAEANGNKMHQIKSVLGNPDTVTANSIFTGVVSDSVSGSPIEGARVTAAENFGWRDTTNSGGAYQISVSPGDFSMMVTASGYFRQLLRVTAAANASVVQNFSLVPKDSGTVTGLAWYHPNLVISQVVASTKSMGADVTQQEIEYVVLFNPTTGAIDIGSTGVSTNKNMNISYYDEESSFDANDTTLNLTHVSTFVPSGKSYLIANASYFFVADAWRTADAYYQPTLAACGSALYCDTIRNDKAGGLELTHVPSGDDFEKVGWSDADNGAPTQEDNAVNLDASDGLSTGRMIVRKSSATEDPDLTELTTYANNYDSGDNLDDFSDRAAVDVAPLSSADAASDIITGVPALGAVVASLDGLSSPVSASNDQSPPVARFTLNGVATGTWMTVLTKDGYAQETASVTILTSGQVHTFTSTETFLHREAVFGFVTGDVTDVLGSAITPGITVSPGGAGDDTTASTDDGTFFLRVDPGSVDVVANPGNSDPTYLSATESVAVDAGEVVSEVFFTLSQGGQITGFVTRDGINALPGVAVAAKDSNGIVRDQQVTDINGGFTTVNVPTGTYTVEPVLGSLEEASPETASVTVTGGAQVFSSTFTISGALGTITGAVTSGGVGIKTGVLIVVSANALSGDPPEPSNVDSDFLAQDPYYMVSSQENGTYTVDVRSGSYLVYAYYTTVSAGGSVTINYLSQSNINVTAGATTSGVDFAW